jgi:magnesium transporter
VIDGCLMTMDGKQLEPTKAKIEDLLKGSVPFWLNLHGDATAGEDDEVHQLLRDAFHLHSLALEDAEHFGQRPKLDPYDDFTLLVVYGPGESDQLVEVHCFCSERYLVTVHRQACPPLSEVVRRVQAGTGPTTLIMVLYRVVDVLVDGYFPVLAALDDRIDELEDEILKRPTEEQLGQLFDMKRSLIGLRKVVTPQRDVFATVVGSNALPGMTPDCEHYFRDLYDHLIRVSDLVDSYRDLLSGALDTHLSTVSNRLNIVMKQLTIIATIFLPLSFLTGFFGQNFAWMVSRIGGAGVFWGLGVGLQIAVSIGLLVMFRRRGWLASVAPAPPPPVPPTASSRPAPWLTVLPPHAPVGPAGDGRAETPTAS